MTALAARRPADPEKSTGSREYMRFIVRLLRKYPARVESGDLPDMEALRQLREIQDELDAQTAATVRALRSDVGGAHSWQEIGDALGMTRAAAFKKFGGADSDARSQGGQPSHLR